MKQLSSIILVLLSLSVLFFTLVGNHGLLHLLEIKKEVSLLTARNQQLDTDLRQVEGDVKDVKTNKFVLEKKVREELGLSRPGEIIYVLPRSGQNGS